MTIEAQRKMIEETDARKAQKGPKIPVFVEEGSVKNPEDLPPGYVLIYLKLGSHVSWPPLFGPSVWA